MRSSTEVRQIDGSPIDPLSTFRLDGRVAIVTGASSGLGARFARVLTAAGAHVAVAARRADRLDALVAELPGALAVPGDLTAPGAPADLVKTVTDHYGRLDVLINNAGAARVGNAVDDDLDGFRSELEIDLVAPYELARQCARWWIAQGSSGSVINIGSVLGIVSGGKMRVPGYTASKGGLHHLTRELAVQWARKGIRVNAIAPAWFETEMNADAIFATDAGLKYITDGTPMGRSGREHELDGAAIFLASDASSYVTGHILAVDGGWTAI